MLEAEAGGSAGAAAVRPAVEDDAGAVCALLGAFRDWLGKPRPDDEELEQSVRRVMAEPGGEYLLAFDSDGAPAGVAQVRYRWSVWTTAEDAWLEDIYVSESQRRGGLGRALLDGVIARARARGCRRIELDVEQDNAAGLALYRSLGFTSESKGASTSLLMGLPLD
jgi:ribosomal protein S18 acetylase RimI-like enzyme